MATIIGAIIVFLLVITLHEFGHFSAAKFSGVKVNEFSIGMGPVIYQNREGETDYSLRLLPMGGYVAMEGEEENSNDPRSFNNATVSKRILITVAGVFMNFVLAIIAFFIVGLISGTPTTTVGSLVENMPAIESGIETGDRIFSINGVETNSWNEILSQISSANDKVEIEINRNGEVIKKEVRVSKTDGRSTIGIVPKMDKSIPNAFVYGFTGTYGVIKDVFTTLKLLFTGAVSVKMLAGPVGVIQIIGQATSLGIVYFLRILGLISANLGVLNLLPIPALDGGRLVFLIFEAITGKRLNEKFEQTINLIGFGLLISLMLYVTVFGDITRLLNR